MKALKKNEAQEKRHWEKPKLTPIQGLDSCVEFLYGTGGTGLGQDFPPPPPPQP